MPSFADIEIDGERRTAIRLIIEDRERRRIDPRAELPDVDLTDDALEAFDALDEALDPLPTAPPGNGHRLN